jgi:isopenicillin-N epimerase
MTRLIPDWSAARARVHLDPTVTMLNTGSFGPTPMPVFDRANELRLQLAAGPTDFFVRRLPPLLWSARERLASFLGTRPHRLVFTANVSCAINLVASGLAIDSPGEILLTDHEYGAMHWCWERQAERRGLELKTFPLPTMSRDTDEIVEAAVKAMTPQTKLFFFSHVLSPTGLVLPAKELCEEARRRGIITVVDGAHAPAMIPLAVDEIGADFYTGNCHKWLLAPIGTGFLAIGPDTDQPLEPLQVSWGYKPDQYPIGEDSVAKGGPDDPDAYGSTPQVRYLEFEGTRDVCPWLATPAAIDFQSELGWENVRDRMAELAAYTRERIRLPLATPADRRLSGAMTAFRLPDGINVLPLRKTLWDHRIEIPVIDRPDRLLIRVSHHFYTTEAEIDRLAEVLPTCLNLARG